MKLATFAMAAIATIALAAPAFADGDAAAGKAVFNKCAICHSPLEGKNVIGPSLFGVVGRHSASIEGFSYSPAMKALDKTWDEATLDTYLTNPKAMYRYEDGLSRPAQGRRPGQRHCLSEDPEIASSAANAAAAPG